MRNDGEEVEHGAADKGKRKPPSLMKKLKLRARRSSVAEELRTSSSEERKTPEGDDHPKSASDTNLAEVSRKSSGDDGSVRSAEVTIRPTEDPKSMPPFGELIVDEQEATVNPL